MLVADIILHFFYVLVIVRGDSDAMGTTPSCPSKEKWSFANLLVCFLMSNEDVFHISLSAGVQMADMFMRAEGVKRGFVYEWDRWVCVYVSVGVYAV